MATGCKIFLICEGRFVKGYQFNQIEQFQIYVEHRHMAAKAPGQRNSCNFLFIQFTGTAEIRFLNKVLLLHRFQIEFSIAKWFGYTNASHYDSACRAYIHSINSLFI